MISAPLPGTTLSQGYTYIATDATGYGNYNALFLTYRLRDFHGISGHQQLHLGPRARYRHHVAGHQFQYGARCL